MLSTDDLDYNLPRDLIATRPCQQREDARLLVLRRSSPGAIEHRHVRDLPEILDRAYQIVMNNTRVVPARLLGRRAGSGGKVEGLFLQARDPSTWIVMLKSNGKLRAGTVVQLIDSSGSDAACALTLLERDDAAWVVQVDAEDADPFAVLAQVGTTPLPPYILKSRRERADADDSEASPSDAQDRDRYQTVYAREDGAVAAPTAGLHFTDALLDRLRRDGHAMSELTLHVGAGTFKPIDVAYVEEHHMHYERIDVPAKTVNDVVDARSKGTPVLAIGTTSVRALESLPADPDLSLPFRCETDLMITPGYEFRFVDALMTNFHLPRSTLLALVGALAGMDVIKEAYAIAVRERYRFYSYGDAMLILP